MQSELTDAPAGNVFVFNVCSEDLSVSANGLKAATINGWTPSGTGQYQPNVAKVARMLNASDGAGNFFNGTNQLNLQYSNGEFVAQVQIDGQAYPLREDLLLFLGRNAWQMVTTWGILMNSGDVISAGEI